MTVQGSDGLVVGDRHATTPQAGAETGLGRAGR
jgi:hypothetical protein